MYLKGKGLTISLKLNNVRALQVFQILKFGMLILIRIILAKLNILTEDIGDFEYFLFLAGAVSFFWVNGIIQSLLPLNRNSVTFGKSSKKSPEIFNAFLLMAGFTLLAVLLLSGYEIAEIGDSSPYFYYLILFIFLSTPANLIEYIYLLFGRTKQIVVYGISIFVLQLSFIALPLFLGYSIDWAIKGLVFTGAIKFVWLFILLQKYSLFKASRSYMMEHLKLGLPLILGAFFAGSAQYVDGFLIKNKFDEETFAVFLYGAKELPVVALLAFSLSAAMVARFANTSDHQSIFKEIKKESARLMHVLFPFSIVLLLITYSIFPIFFRAEFVESAGIFNIYLLLIISRLVFPQAILIGLKQTQTILKISIIELVINVILSILFIQWWGIMGVAYATVIAYFIDKLYLAFITWKKFNIKPKEYTNLPLLGIYSVLLVAAYLVVELVIY